VAQFGGRLPAFGESIVEFEESRSWINDCAWSPSGLQLCFVGHDCQVHIVAFSASAAAAPVICTVKGTGLPASKVFFLNEDAVVTAGHNMTPEVFYRKEAGAQGWAMLDAVDKRDADVASTTGTTAAAGNRMSTTFGSARALFASKVTTGQAGPTGGSEDWMKHQGAITCIGSYATKAGGKGITQISTSGNDGKIVIWNLPQYAHLAALKL
jgi:WD40 repeat protein